jgi:hypothetical protein
MYVSCNARTETVDKARAQVSEKSEVDFHLSFFRLIGKCQNIFKSSCIRPFRNSFSHYFTVSSIKCSHCPSHSSSYSLLLMEPITVPQNSSKFTCFKVNENNFFPQFCILYLARTQNSATLTLSHDFSPLEHFNFQNTFIRKTNKPMLGTFQKK